MTGSKIMVVDDEEGIRELLSEVLSVQGFDVTAAKDGAESLKYMKRDNFDLVVTDINMPHINGIELLKRMKKAGRKEKIVVMTGSAFDYSGLAKEIPLVCYQLKKPFKMDDFLKIVSSALGLKKGRTGIRTAKRLSRKDKRCYSN